MPQCCSSSAPASMALAAAVPAVPAVPQRPRGLWRARSHAAASPASHAPENIFHKHPLFHHHRDPRDTTTAADALSADDSDAASSQGSSRKRARLAAPDTPPTSDEEVHYWDYSRKCSPYPRPREDKWTTRSKLMDTTTTAGPGARPPAPTHASAHATATAPAAAENCDQEDWEDLKELFARAAEIYENQAPREAMPLLRGVIHECHRFMRLYHDPSVVYAPPAPPDPPRRVLETPPEQRLIRDWLTERPPLYPPQGPETELLAKAKARLGAEKEEKKCKCKDLPTAFYTILGTTLFFFGNLIDQDPALAAAGEAPRPTPYWLSAIDVFEIGENLPVRTSGRRCPSAPEDWRMAIIWGRTLVCLAHEALVRDKDAPAQDPKTPKPTDPFADFEAMFSFRLPRAGEAARIGGFDFSDDGEEVAPEGTTDEPAWPKDSPFALIAERRMPRTSRMSFANTTPEEMMLIAKDQFSRGIFHMPHPLHHARRFPSSAPAPAVKALPAVFTCTPPLAAYYATTNTTTAAAATEPAPTTPPPPVAEESASAEEEPATEGPTGLLPGETFSRAKELFTIATEVLDVAERFPAPGTRAMLAAFADGVLSQMKLEAHTERAGGAYAPWAGAGAIVLARGRANLIVGAAKAEELEEALERGGEGGVWGCDEAIDGREALGVAVVYLEKAREALVAKREEEEREAARGEAIVVEPAEALSDDEYEMDEDEEEEEYGGGSGKRGEEEGETTVEEVGTLLAEALLTLANLTEDAKEREVLYARAMRESGDAIVLDDEDEDMDG